MMSSKTKEVTSWNRYPEPRIEIIHDLSEDEKQCGCGARLSRFGEEIIDPNSIDVSNLD